MITTDRDTIIKSLDELTDKTISDLDAIMQAIKACGMEVPGDMPILKYADLIRSIPHKYVEDADVTAGDVLAGKTAYGSAGRLTGAMTDNGAVAYNLPVNGSYTIPAGYHNGGGVVSQSGVDDTGVNTDDATMSAAQVLAGYTGYARGAKVTGTMPYHGVTQYNLPVNGTFWIAEGYHPAGGYITQSGVQVGTDTSDATLINGDQIISGYTAYARGTKVTGTMPVNNVIQYSLPVNGTVYLPAGYHPAGGYITQSGVQAIISASGTTTLAKTSGSFSVTPGIANVVSIILQDGPWGMAVIVRQPRTDTWQLVAGSNYGNGSGIMTSVSYTSGVFRAANQYLWDILTSAAGRTTTLNWIAYGY